MFSLVMCINLHGSLLDSANARYANGIFNEAVILYKKAALSGETPALCYFNTANAYFQLDSLPQALMYYQATLSCAPDFFKAYMNLAVVYYTLDDMGQCISVMQRGLAIEPANTKARLILAAAYRKAGALPQAVVDFEQVALQAPDMEEPFIALGEIYRDLGDADAAVRWLQSYPQSGKNQAYVYSVLAELCESNDDPAKALYYQQQAFKLDNTRRWTLYKIVILHQKSGNDLVGYEVARQGMEQFPDFAEMAVIAGNIAFARNRYSEARWCYEKAYALGSMEAVVGLENVRTITKSMAGNP